MSKSHNVTSRISSKVIISQERIAVSVHVPYKFGQKRWQMDGSSIAKLPLQKKNFAKDQ